MVPEDVLDVIKPTTAHRVEISDRARAMKLTEEEAISEAIRRLKVPKR